MGVPPGDDLELRHELGPDAVGNEAGEALRRWGKLPAWEQDVAGYLLRQAREGAGLTQRELAARLGVTQQAIAQAERWDANPCLDLLRRWAAATGSVLVLSFEVRCLVRHA